MLKIEQVLRDENGENVLNDYFDSIIIKADSIIVKKNNLYGIYNLHTFKKILDCEWDKVIFDTNYILAYKYSQIAVFDCEGTKILNPEWDKVVLYEKGILTTKNGAQGFFKYNGTTILECVWKRIEPYANVILAYRGEGAKRILYNYEGNVIEG